MARALIDMAANVERLPGAFPPTVVSDELRRIRSLLQALCPGDGIISFDFDGRLQVHIDVRKREEVMLIQALLPTLETGLFHNIGLGNTPHRPFFHRISAEVAR